jgi:thioesterase domain-containing protein
MRHVLLRGEFCSKKCFEACRKDESRMRDWVIRHRTDDQANVPTPHGNLGRDALSSGVVQLQEGRADSSLYFIGADLTIFRIAQMMGPGHAIFGVEVPWTLAWRDAAANNKVSALPTMEQLVAPYVAAVSSYSCSSPCALAGYSFAGLIAFEAAHQLHAKGVKVEMVILLDAAATYPAPHQVAWQELQKDWKRAPKRRSIASRLGSPLSIIRWMLVKEMRRLGRRFLQVVLRDLDELTGRLDDMGMPLHWGLVERVYMNAVRSYRLRRLDCRGILFRADPKDERPARSLDGSLGWDNLFSRGLEIIEVPGDHMTTMLREPYNLTLARGMNELLDRHFTRPSDELGRIF